MINNLFVFFVIKVQYCLQLVGPDFSCLSASIFVRPGFPQVIQIAHFDWSWRKRKWFCGNNAFLLAEINWISVSWHAANFIHSRIQDGGTREHLSL